MTSEINAGGWGIRLELAMTVLFLDCVNLLRLQVVHRDIAEYIGYGCAFPLRAGTLYSALLLRKIICNTIQLLIGLSCGCSHCVKSRNLFFHLIPVTPGKLFDLSLDIVVMEENDENKYQCYGNTKDNKAIP